MKKNKKVHKLTKTEKALLYLAFILENPKHYDYNVRQYVMDILNLEKVKN